MKRALEAALVLAALAMGAYVVRQGLVRRALAEHPPVLDPALAPGADVASSDPSAPPPPRGGVTGLPMVKLFRPPKRVRLEVAVPPP
ncbi:MAG TPA: hypothetical protein VH309_12255 [Elusimicrobiota bacterium]|jgi:hypothetical protein|nr:hypothetical protein [Elusimicrobiota bacterium]